MKPIDDPYLGASHFGKGVIFKETNSQNFYPETTQHETTDEPVSVLIQELEDNQAANLDIQVSACPPEEIGRCPPRFQSLITKQMVYLQNGEVRLFSADPDCNDKKEDSLHPPDIWFELGNPHVFPVHARIRCHKRQVIVDLLGEPGKTYSWTVHARGALYQGQYLQPRS
jgi:hypothetical protein